MRKNILLFVLVLVISLATAPYFGGWYDKFSPHYGSWTYSKEDSVFFTGFVLNYIFFTPFIFELLGKGNKKKCIIGLIVPPTLLWIFADIYYIYIPISLGLVGFALAKLISIIISKLKKPNLPMVVK